MAYSMTGYGKVNEVINSREITVEIKSVNHRYFEYSSRIHRIYFALDDKIKKEVSSKVARGKVEVSVSIKNIENTNVVLSVDLSLAKSYYDALGEIAEHLGVQKNQDVLSISKFEGVLTAQKNEEDTEALWQDVKVVLDKAVLQFLQMRKIEGEKLKEDVLLKLSNVSALLNKVETIAPLRVKEYTEKLYQKLKEILKDKQIDEARILTEAAVFADKVVVDEEITRLKSHIIQFENILKENSSQGRKLDFLTQELNREANTIGSKSNDINITRLVVDMKSEIEKIKEQIQNIE